MEGEAPRDETRGTGGERGRHGTKGPWEGTWDRETQAGGDGAPAGGPEAGNHGALEHQGDRGEDRGGQEALRLVSPGDSAGTSSQAGRGRAGTKTDPAPGPSRGGGAHRKGGGVPGLQADRAAETFEGRSLVWALLQREL